MNKVIIAGTICNQTYKLVDKGKVYAIIFIKLKVEKVKEEIEIIAKNNIADFMYRTYKIGDKILIEGYLQKTKEGLIVVVNNVEKIDGKVDKKPVR